MPTYIPVNAALDAAAHQEGWSFAESLVELIKPKVIDHVEISEAKVEELKLTVRRVLFENHVLAKRTSFELEIAACCIAAWLNSFCGDDNPGWAPYLESLGFESKAQSA